MPKPKEEDSVPKGREKKFGLRKSKDQQKQLGKASPHVHGMGGKKKMENEEDRGDGEPAITDSYHQLSHQLTDLTRTLHVKASRHLQNLG